MASESRDIQSVIFLAKGDVVYLRSKPQSYLAKDIRWYLDSIRMAYRILNYSEHCHSQSFGYVMTSG